MKFALVSSILPPSASGQAMVLYRLLKGLKGKNYCLISQEDYGKPVPEHSYTERLPTTYYCLPVDTVIWRGGRWHLPQRAGHVCIALGIISRARRIASIVRTELCEAVVACTGGWDCLNMPASYLASRIARIPFYAYIFDYYSKQWEGPNHWGHGDYLRLAQRLESKLLRAAAGIIVPNEFLGSALHDRYGVEPTVIHNPCDLSRYELSYNEKAIGEDGEIRIVYTGDIYDAHFDAFANLLEAIKLTGRENLKLHAYVIRSEEYLRENGISGPALVLHPHAPLDKIPEIQRCADILFLALAFHSPYPEGNATAAPGKIGEYLASGRPILVHAPADSFTAWYFREHECGLVVDTDDVEALAHGIEQLLTEESLAHRFVTNALARARADFSVVAGREKFAAIFDEAQSSYFEQRHGRRA
jgi:glycosyltransferase involved in cell wall biosynthesis